MGRKALPEGERRKAYTVRLTPEVAAWFETKGVTLNDGVNAVGLSGLAGRVVMTPIPVGTRVGEPPSGGKCKSPFKCGRGIIACDPCRAVVEEAK